MASQIQKGHTYNPGDVVDAADLNSLVDNATALKGLIHTQLPLATAIDPVNDEAIIWDQSVDDLRRAKIHALPSGVTSVAMTVAPTSVFASPGPVVTTTGTFSISLKDQTGNKVLAAPADGTSAAPIFRALTPADSNQIITVGANTINLTLGNTFYKILPDTSGARVLNLVNGTPGQTIRVIVRQGAGPGTNTLTWGAVNPDDVVRWPNGTHPVMSIGAGATDIYQFTLLRVDSGVYNYYGTFYQAFYV